MEIGQINQTWTMDTPTLKLVTLWDLKDVLGDLELTYEIWWWDEREKFRSKLQKKNLGEILEQNPELNGYSALKLLKSKNKKLGHIVDWSERNMLQGALADAIFTKYNEVYLPVCRQDADFTNPQSLGIMSVWKEEFKNIIQWTSVRPKYRPIPEKYSIYVANEEAEQVA
jgi:hypothetical protein